LHNIAAFDSLAGARFRAAGVSGQMRKRTGGCTMMCRTVLTVLLALGWAAATAQAADPPYVHTVIFYLKKDAPKSEVAALIKDSHELLGKIPTVKKLMVGRPAEMATPEYAIKDYQVGLLVLFDDFAGLKTYLEHPLHTEFLKKHGEFWDKVPVYDFINQTK
jgi:hypothetical protein